MDGESEFWESLEDEDFFCSERDAKEFMMSVVTGMPAQEAAEALGYTVDFLRGQAHTSEYLQAAFEADLRRAKSKAQKTDAKKALAKVDFRTPEGFHQGLMEIIAAAGGHEKLFEWVCNLDPTEFREVELLSKIMLRLAPQHTNNKNESKEMSVRLTGSTEDLKRLHLQAGEQLQEIEEAQGLWLDHGEKLKELQDGGPDDEH